MATARDVLALWLAFAGIHAACGQIDVVTRPTTASVVPARWTYRIPEVISVRMPRNPGLRIRADCHSWEPSPSRTGSGLVRTLHQTMRLFGREARDPPVFDRLRIIDQFSDSVTDLRRKLVVVAANLQEGGNEEVVSGTEELKSYMVSIRDQLDSAGIDADTETMLKLRIFGMMIVEKLDDVGGARAVDVELAQMTQQTPQIYRLLLDAYAMIYFVMMKLETIAFRTERSSICSMTAASDCGSEYG